VAVFDVKEVDAAVTQPTHDDDGGGVGDDDASSDSSASPVVVAVVVVASWMTSVLETWASYCY
jgi:hypothetical protein